jgi:hypothetical protein
MNSTFRASRSPGIRVFIDGFAARVYVNGDLLAADETVSGAVRMPEQPDLEAAAYLRHEPNMRLGNLLRELRVYGRALSAHDIAHRFEQLQWLVEEGVLFDDRFHFTAGPYLNYVTQTGMRFIWETDRPSTAELHYGSWFLDKIDYLQIKLPGQHTLGLTSLRGRLTYGGASFIRRFNVGAPDAERPDRLRNELTSYSTRYWFFDPTPGIARWRFTDALTIDSVRMELARDDRVPPEIDRVLAFKERSVAATGWVLEIPTVSQGTEGLRIDDLNDVEIYFSHFSAQRQ